MEEEKMVQIGTDDVDVRKIMEKIQARIEEKKKAGVYEKYDLSGIPRLELENISREEDFLNYYIDLIQKKSQIDIGDFEIINEGGPLGRIEVLMKKIIWKLLKFYTFRLFSQQREFDCQVTSAFLSLRQYTETRFKEIHERLDYLTKDKNS